MGAKYGRLADMIIFNLPLVQGFRGRDIGIEQQNYSAQLSYFHTAGISAGMGMIWYSQFNPRLYATSLMLGYSGKFGKSNDYRYRSSYNRYFFSKMDSVD